MTTTAYKTSVRFSEQSHAKQSLTGADLSAREKLLEQVIFRDQVQTAIEHLIRGYEASTGCSVVRLEYEPHEGRVTLEALPL